MAEVSQTKSSSDCIFGSVSLIPNRSPVMEKTDLSPLNPSCPQCGSQKVWRDGVRNPIPSVTIQRWLCRNCEYRFSDQNDIQKSHANTEKITRNPEMTLKTEANILSSRQICVTAKETKNLVSTTELKTVVGEREKSLQKLEKRIGHRYQKKPVDPEIRALSEVLRSWLKKEGFKEGLYPNYILTLSRMGANLKDPESVKEVIAKHDVKEGTKLKYVYAYDALCRMLKISWTLPKYKQEEAYPFVPDKSELEQLIAASHSRRFAAYLQLLKETWPDPTEALRIEYGEVNGNVVSINHPVKDHMARQIEVSDELIAMLNSLGIQRGRYFPMTYKTLYSCFSRLRNRVAKMTGNPRFNQITLNSFRHWGGTMLAYYSNGNVLYVKKNLGHRRVENTMKYIDMSKALAGRSCEFESISVTSNEEILALGKDGWEKYDEATFQGVTFHYYRRPKRFGALDNKAKSKIRKSY